MRRFRAFILVVLCALGAYRATADAQQRPQLRVLHWNVLHSGSGTDGVLDRGRQVAWIARQTPDIVTLNEVTESAAAEYLARLRAATGRDWFLHHVAAVRGSDGNAILSRFPMLATGGRVLTHARSVAHATIGVEGTPVNVFSTHIESGKERASRAEQVGLLLPYLAEFAPPRIVNGDLNAGPDAAEIQPLLASYVDAWQEAVRQNAAVSYVDNPPGRYTRTRGARIDYILTSPDGPLQVAACEIPDQREGGNVNVSRLIRTSDDTGVRPSDHNFVSCTLAWQGSAQSQPVNVRRTTDGEADVVLWAVDATVRPGWSVVVDSDAAGGARLSTRDAGVAIKTPQVFPSRYFDLTFHAHAGRPYRLWLRGRAQNSHRLNDSVYVQFSDSVTASGVPVYRIGTTSATVVILEEFLHAGLSEWGWADNGWGQGVLGPDIYFAVDGPQTLRVQMRQDGVSIDQVVLSSGAYFSTPPGPTKDDHTILARTALTPVP
jgi:endonuclease/exonuclease/phosphatase family metal-dependent hydrolase